MSQTNPEDVDREKMHEGRGYERPFDNPEQMSDETRRRLRAQNARRVRESYRELEARSVRARELARTMGVSPERLRGMAERRELLGVPLLDREETVYPTWQFDPETGRTIEGLPELMRVAEEEVGMGPGGLDAFMTMPQRRGGGIVAVERFKEGEEGRAWVFWALRTASEVPIR